MTRLTLAIRDATTMIGREFKHTQRFPLLLVGTIMVPVVMLLLFDYILGGPIGNGLGSAAHGAPYVDFLVPGILLMTVAASCGPTAINVNTDVTGGIIDRIRTMAVTRGALLAGAAGIIVLAFSRSKRLGLATLVLCAVGGLASFQIFSEARFSQTSSGISTEAAFAAQADSDATRLAGVFLRNLDEPRESFEACYRLIMLRHTCLTVLDYRLQQQQGPAPNQDIAPSFEWSYAQAEI